MSGEGLMLSLGNVNTSGHLLYLKGMSLFSWSRQVGIFSLKMSWSIQPARTFVTQETVGHMQLSMLHLWEETLTLQ